MIFFNGRPLLAMPALILAFALIQVTVWATSINPLDDGGWRLVAHMSNAGGMFDGNGQLAPGYSYGTFVANPTAATPDFARPFPVVASEILFITGDVQVWGITDYNALRTLIDAVGGDFAPNIAFEIGEFGVISNATGNVLSRPSQIEDPWISIEGDHISGINNDRIVWGEANFFGAHVDLKNTHGGLNVYVREIPEPSTIFLFALGIAGLARITCSRRKSA